MYLQRLALAMDTVSVVRNFAGSAPAKTEASADDTFPARLQLAVVAVKAVVAGAGVVELVVVTVAASGAGLVPAPVVCRVIDAR